MEGHIRRMPAIGKHIVRRRSRCIRAVSKLAISIVAGFFLFFEWQMGGTFFAPFLSHLHFIGIIQAGLYPVLMVEFTHKNLNNSIFVRGYIMDRMIQISFHTRAALDCLKYMGSEVMYDGEE